jgi:CRISPR/Cas system CMR-associated protein Cmr3 (group 5 of RAMP superfamily)
MNKNMQEAKNSCAVTENIKDKESRVGLAVDKMLEKPVSKKETAYEISY